MHPHSGQQGTSRGVEISEKERNEGDVESLNRNRRRDETGESKQLVGAKFITPVKTCFRETRR